MKKQVILSDARLYVSHWFHKLKSFKMEANGQFDGQNSDNFNNLWLDYVDEVAIHQAKTGIKLRPILESNMEKAWSLFKREEKDRVLNSFKDQIGFKNESDEHLNNWLDAVSSENSSLVLNAMKHFLWQVKRKLNGKPVVYHLMPVFVGKQNGGKSTAIRALLKPLEHVMLEMPIKELVDSRNAQSLENNYICFFDEMAHMEKTNIEALKGLITDPFRAYRPMRTNDSIKVRQNCTFIGASNRSLIESIYDPTGLRRFIEILARERVNRELLNKVDVVKVWQSVDESLERGYIEDRLPELQEHQRLLHIPDEVEQFVLDCKLMPTSKEDIKEIPFTEIWNIYNQWRIPAGYGSRQALVASTLGIRLSSYNLKDREIRRNKKDVSIYIVSKSFGLPKKVLEEAPVNVLEFKKEAK